MRYEFSFLAALLTPIIIATYGNASAPKLPPLPVRPQAQQGMKILGITIGTLFFL